MNIDESEDTLSQAQQFVNQGNFEQGRQLLERLVSQEMHLDDEMLASIYLLLGRTKYYTGEFDSGLEDLRKVQKKAEEVSTTHIEAIRFEGIILAGKGEVKAAKECYTKALQVARKTGQKKCIAALLNNIATLHQGKGEYDLAFEILDEGLSIAVEIEDKQESTKLLNNIAEIYSKKGKYDLAFEYYQRSILIDRQIGSQVGEAIKLNNIAEIYRARGEYKKSIEYLKEAFNIAKVTGDKGTLAVILSNLGEVNWLEGNILVAIEDLEQAHEICQQVGIEDIRFRRILLLLVGIETEKADFTKAEVYLEKSIALNERLHSDTFRAEILCFQGFLEAPGKGKGNKKIARAAYEDAIELAKRITLNDVLIGSSFGLADLIIHEYLETSELNKIEEALDSLKKAHFLAKNRNNPFVIAYILLLQGLLSIGKEHYDTAYKLLFQANMLAEEHNLGHLLRKINPHIEKVDQIRNQQVSVGECDEIKKNILLAVQNYLYECKKLFPKLSS